MKNLSRRKVFGLVAAAASVPAAAVAAPEKFYNIPLDTTGNDLERIAITVGLARGIEYSGALVSGFDPESDEHLRKRIVRRLLTMLVGEVAFIPSKPSRIPIMFPGEKINTLK